MAESPPPAVRSPKLRQALPFGGGTRRCAGADFATTEMDVVLRTVLQNFTIRTDTAADERSHFRGITHAPQRGACIVLSRRRPP